MKYITNSLLFFLLFISFFSNGQFEASTDLEMSEDKVSWEFSLDQDGCKAVIIGKLVIQEHWHINAFDLPEDNFGMPTELLFQPSDNYTLVGKPQEPEPVTYYEPKAKETLKYHEGTIFIKQEIEVTSQNDFDLNFELTFQPCDSVKCLMPHTEELTIAVKGCKTQTKTTQENDNVINHEAQTDTTSKKASDTSKIETKQETPPTTKADETNTLAERVENKSLWRIFLLSFVSGFAALLTPCVFPMIPMTVSFFTKQSKTKLQGQKNATIYGVSIIVIYILLGGLVTALFGADSLNNMATDPTFNIIFFLLLVFFAISFMGAFEIRLPNSWINKADQRADKGGLIGIFFMALALALVSFSCTGPIIGALLVKAATEGGIAPFIGMFGFSLALALPFTLFALFPAWLNSLPKSGGWLNTVKVVLGILELALAFKFLSNADLALQTHLLERELFLAIWIAIFSLLAIYLFGFIRLPHDSPIEYLSVGRTFLGLGTLVFVIYMIPGMWGAPLKLISAFPPPMSYSESPLGFGGSGQQKALVNLEEGMHIGPQNIPVFHDYDKALAYAQKVNKPLMLDFTGHNCVNCRKMEQSVWGEPGIIDILKQDVVIASLHVDERVRLPENEQTSVTLPNGKSKRIRTVGDKWMVKQIMEYRVTAQPYYRMLTPEGKHLSNGSADYQNHRNAANFRAWLSSGMEEFKKLTAE